MKLDPRNEDDGEIGAACGLQQIGRDIQLLMFRDVYTGLVEERVPGRLRR